MGGIFTLELGSLTFNSWCVDEALRELPDWFPCWPRCSGSVGRHIVTYSYYVCMSLSNIVGGYFLVLATQQCLAAASHLGTAAYGYVVFYVLSGPPLLILRQKECVDAMKGDSKEP